MSPANSEKPSSAMSSLITAREAKFRVHTCTLCHHAQVVVKAAACARSSHVFDQGGWLIGSIDGGEIGADQVAFGMRRVVRHLSSGLFPETRTQDSGGGLDEDGDGGEESAPTHGGGEEDEKVDEEEEELQWKGPGL